jgi:glycosyltransferase involved in cell wall biosynthesis
MSRITLNINRRIIYKNKYDKLTVSLNTTSQEINNLRIELKGTIFGNADATVLAVSYDLENRVIKKQRIRLNKSKVLNFNFDHSKTEFLIRYIPWGLIFIKSITVEEIISKYDYLENKKQEISKESKSNSLNENNEFNAPDIESNTAEIKTNISNNQTNLKDVLVLTHTAMYYDDRIKRQVNKLINNWNVHLFCKKDLNNSSYPLGLSTEVKLIEHYPIRSRGQVAAKIMDLLFKLNSRNQIKALKGLIRRIGNINMEMLYFDYLPIYQEAYRDAINYLEINKLHSSIKFILANDVLILPLASRLQRIILKETGTKVPIIADMHEVHFDYNVADKFNQSLRRWLCSSYLNKCELVISVSNQIIDLYTEKYALSNTMSIYNAPYYKVIRPSPIGPEIELVHIGGASIKRKLEFMIDAMLLLPKHFKLSFHLTTSHSVTAMEYLDYLNKRIVELNLQGRVFIKDTIEPDVLEETINQYDIGIFYLNGEVMDNYKYAMPNKLFQYIHGRLAVVVSDYGEMRRVVEDNEVGIIPENRSIESYSNAIRLVADNLEQYKKNTDVAAKVLDGDKEWNKLINFIDDNFI